MDGSCNGLQHYAALGRDAEGALHVNVRPSPQPQDVYSAVLARVQAKVAADAAENHPEACLLHGHVTRKVIKQTVMTSVYGVTLPGARLQVEARLRDLAAFRGREEKEVWKCSFYTAKLALESLGEVFAQANAMKDWLANLASAVVKGAGRPMEWTTPAGLRVVQPYREERTYQVRTRLQTISLLADSEEAPLNTAKQRSAFPPNFVHSVDAAHMLRTALACRREGLEFAAVHDSFWTHAATTHTLHGLLRAEFADLHRADLAEELYRQTCAAFPELAAKGAIPPPPPRGDLDLDEVLRSDYFFN